MTRSELREALQAYFAGMDDKTKRQELTWLRGELQAFSDKRHNPVDNVLWVNYNMVEANDYNPNAVARREMKLLYTSIKHDGYTQPIVTIWDEDKQKYVIVDGFHRYATMVYNKDLRELNNSEVPIVVLDKDINDRMASTIRHNRARGRPRGRPCGLPPPPRGWSRSRRRPTGRRRWLSPLRWSRYRRVCR